MGNVYVGTYEEAREEFKRARDPFKGRKVNNNTWLVSLGTDFGGHSVYGIKLHDTVIVEYSASGAITLDSGGWRTLTTRNRMNDYTDGISVQQRKHIWYVTAFGDQEYLFRDGICITATGAVLNTMTKEQWDEELKLQKEINKYAQKFADAMPVELPSSGDCWYCSMVEEGTGRPWGDLSKDRDHLLSHIEEEYFVPSLALLALREAGYRDIFILQLSNMFILPDYSPSSGSVHRDALKRALNKYLYKRLLWDNFERGEPKR